MKNTKHFTEDETIYIRDIDRRVRNLFTTKSYTPAINDLQIQFVNRYFDKYFLHHIKDAESTMNAYIKEMKLHRAYKNMWNLLESQKRHNLINEYLNGINCEHGLLESSYKIIMNVLNIREKFENYTFNIIAFKFKYNKEGCKKIETLEEARELFIDLCKILDKEYCISYYDEFMLTELKEFNDSARKENIMPDVFKKNFMKTIEKYEIPILKFDYLELYRELKDLFIGISPFTLYTIIENQSLMDYQRPPIINYIDNNGLLTTNNKADIMCFGDCFGIKPKKLSEIFGFEIKDCRNSKKRSKLYYALKKINPDLYS